MDDLLRFDYHDVRPGTRYVSLTGEADLTTADQLQQDLGRLLAPQWVTHLRLNLTALRFLDCAALSALLQVREKAHEHGQQVTITAVRGGPARVIALSGGARLLHRPLATPAV
ncbi:STAS domain-containing protein [Micromonospora zingiberis]|nr:STAS domain-containing protein [Micromonospora zingiberis]